MNPYTYRTPNYFFVLFRREHSDAQSAYHEATQLAFARNDSIRNSGSITRIQRIEAYRRAMIGAKAIGGNIRENFRKLYATFKSL